MLRAFIINNNTGDCEQIFEWNSGRYNNYRNKIVITALFNWACMSIDFNDLTANIEIDGKVVNSIQLKTIMSGSVINSYLSYNNSIYGRCMNVAS